MPASIAPQTPNLSSNRAQSALLEGLQPALRSTLSSLNINLDYELARYRYAKRGETPPGTTAPNFQPRRRSLNLINVPQATQPSPPNPVTRAAGTPPPPPPNPRLQQVASPPGMAKSPSEVAALRSAIVQQAARSPETYLASSAALLQNFDAPPSSPRHEPSPEQASRRWTESVMTPLGLGALMLLLVASAGFGFVLVNPSAASHLFQNTPLARFFPSEEEEAAAIADAEADEDVEATTDFDEPPLTALSPDLSQREFNSLDLNDLSTLPSNSASLSAEDDPLANTDPAAATTNRDRLTSDPAAVAGATPRNLPQRVNQIPIRTTPAPQPAAPTYVEPAPAPAAPPTYPAPPAAETPTQPGPPAISEGSREPVSSYYVVTDYTGDPSLDAARSAVGEAYVRNFDVGARIQMGAFNTPEGAEALAEELRNQGIETEIYEP